MKVYIVDNGGQWTHREWRVLRYLGVDTRIVKNTTPFDEISDVDGLVAKTKGLGLQDATLRDAAVRALETRSSHAGVDAAR